MAHCAVCGEYLHADEEWRLRPEIPPGTLETEVDGDYDEAYMHPDCRAEYVLEGNDD